MGYVMDLRKIVGSRPLVITGAAVIISDENNRLLLQLRRIIIAGSWREVLWSPVKHWKTWQRERCLKKQG